MILCKALLDAFQKRRYINRILLLLLLLLLLLFYLFFFKQLKEMF